MVITIKIKSFFNLSLLTVLVCIFFMLGVSQVVSASVIRVGTMGTYSPFSYVDENNELTGYDLDVLREIAKRDAELQFDFIASPWDTLFPGLDANRFQLLANQIAATPERQIRYNLTDNAYFISVSQFIVNSQRNDLNTEQDLKGKRVGLTIGDAHTLRAEEWNAKHNNLFEIVYYDGDLPIILQDIANGRIDATFNNNIMAKFKADTQGLQIKTIGERISSTPTYFIVAKNAQGQALKMKLDQGLQQLIADGTLSQLSIKWFGQDYTHN